MRCGILKKINCYLYKIFKTVIIFSIEIVKIKYKNGINHNKVVNITTPKVLI